MKEISKGVAFAGISFLTLGMIWLGVIYVRAKSFLPQEERKIIKLQSPAASYQELKTEMKATLEAPSVIDHYIESKAEPAKPDKTYLKMFWIIAGVEVVCCFLYIFLGISLLRVYPFARFLVFLTLYCDILLKSMVVTYMNNWAIPLEKVLQGQNVLYSYFSPPQSYWSAKFSTYLTGSEFYEPQGPLFLFIYLIYLFSCFYFFTRPDIKQQLAK